MKKEYDVTITIMDVVEADSKKDALDKVLEIYDLTSADIADSEVVCWEDEL